MGRKKGSHEEMLYSIGQVSAITGIAKPTIRYWEKEFHDFLNPSRSPGNCRRFSKNDIEVIERINHLVRVEGYTLKGAWKRLKADAEKPPPAPIPDDGQLAKLVDTMSDYLLKKLLAKTTD